MAAWNDDYETDATRLFVRDRSMQRMADANAERLAHQIRRAPTPAYQHHRWLHVHIHAPHFSH